MMNNPVILNEMGRNIFWIPDPPAPDPPRPLPDPEPPPPARAAGGLLR